MKNPKPDISKADTDRMSRHMREANAAIVEIVGLQRAGKNGKSLREAVRHREQHTRGLVSELVRPRDGVLEQLREK